MTTVYSDEELLNTLRRLAQGELTLGRRTYEQRRHEDDPSAHLYTHRFGSWNKALVAAGLSRTTQPVQLQDATTKWAEPQMLAALRDCRSETGTLTVRAYEAWRLNPVHPKLHVPPATSIRARFGQWSAAAAKTA